MSMRRSLPTGVTGTFQFFSIELGQWARWPNTCLPERRREVEMKFVTGALPVLMMAGLSGAMQSSLAAGAFPAAAVVQGAAAEPGVVFEGTSLVVKTDDSITARKAYKNTLYGASVAENVVGRNDRVLIPKGATVELSVGTLSYLGPGGAGMSELALEVRSVTVNGITYPVTTIGEPLAGGLDVNRYVAKVEAGGEQAGRVRTSGRRVDVPRGTWLAFQLQNPVRLRVAQP